MQSMLTRTLRTIQITNKATAFRSILPQQQKYNFHTSPTFRSGLSDLQQYNILEYDPGRIEITGYISKGFNVGQVRVFGSLIATTNEFFSWNVTRFEDITIESLKFFEYLNPTPHILVIGTGDDHALVSREIREHFKQAGIIIEEMSTKHALATFNVLNQEGRNVACALLSVEPLDPRDVTPEKIPNLFIEIEEISKNDPAHLREQQMRKGGFH
jgi:NADH dehydrogenase [ubiquinone] 1 alpha subcomplex assembly factor 3